MFLTLSVCKEIRRALKTTWFWVSLTYAKETCCILMYNMFQTLSSRLERMMLLEFGWNGIFLFIFFQYRTKYTYHQHIFHFWWYFFPCAFKNCKFNFGQNTLHNFTLKTKYYFIKGTKGKIVRIIHWNTNTLGERSLGFGTTIILPPTVFYQEPKHGNCSISFLCLENRIMGVTLIIVMINYECLHGFPQCKWQFLWRRILQYALDHAVSMFNSQKYNV